MLFYKQKRKGTECSDPFERVICPNTDHQNLDSVPSLCNHPQQNSNSSVQCLFKTLNAPKPTNSRVTVSQNVEVSINQDNLENSKTLNNKGASKISKIAETSTVQRLV